MAVTVNIYYTGTGGNARKFVKEMISGGVVGEIRREKYGLHMKVERYVSDEAGIPEKDTEFIRE